jgi:DnaJ-class molecular chaperone
MMHIKCDACDGDGVVLANSHGYFSMAAEQWYPDDSEMDCDECNGEGMIEVNEEDDA